MVSAWRVKRDLPVMDRESAHRYDLVDPYPDEGELLELPGPRSRYEQLAALIRSDIYAGTYPSGAALPSEPVLAERHKMSRALVNRALQVLGDEDLVSQEQGRGTFVQPRRRYYAEVAVRWRPDGPVPEKAFGDAAGALGPLTEADPAVTDADLTASGSMVTATMDVEAPNVARAVIRAWEIARQALAAPGWDLAGASATAHPVGAASRDAPGRQDA